MYDSPIHSLVQHCSERLWWDWEGVATYADGRAGRGTAEQVALGGAGAWSQCWILGNLGKGIGEQIEACYWCCCYCWGRGAWNRTGAGWDWAGKEGKEKGEGPGQGKCQADRLAGQGKRDTGRGKEAGRDGRERLRNCKRQSSTQACGRSSRQAARVRLGWCFPRVDAVDATCCTVTHGLSRKPVNLGKTKETDCWGSHFPSAVL